MILFYYVNWLLNLLLQKSVASLLSLRMRSIKYLTIGENKIESINIFVTRLSVDNFISLTHSPQKFNTQTHKHSRMQLT